MTAALDAPNCIISWAVNPVVGVEVALLPVDEQRADPLVLNAAKLELLVERHLEPLARHQQAGREVVGLALHAFERSPVVADALDVVVVIVGVVAPLRLQVLAVAKQQVRDLVRQGEAITPGARAGHLEQFDYERLEGDAG